MSITQEDLHKLLRFAKISVSSEDELTEMTESVNNMISQIDLVSTIEIDGPLMISPGHAESSHVGSGHDVEYAEESVANVWRQDQEETSVLPAFNSCIAIEI